MRNQKSNIYIMGSTFSQDKILLDCSYHQLPFTKRTKPACSAWGYTKAKNYDYYFKRPATHISRSNYRCYQRGYIWGYYNVDVDYGKSEEKKNNKTETLSKEITRAF